MARKKWWKQETVEMALEVWQAKQSRDGNCGSLFFPIPAGQTEMRITMDADAFILPAQTVEFQVLLAYDDSLQSPQPGGGTLIRGDPDRRDKQGNPIPSDAIPVVTVQLLADPYPKHACLDQFIRGQLTCGFQVEFSPRDY